LKTTDSGVTKIPKQFTSFLHNTIECI